MVDGQRSENILIGTHNGKFHADEVVACVLLKSLPEYRDAEIIRTRDSSELDRCSVVVDVGGVFNPQVHRYDHHQRGFDLTFHDFFPGSEWNIKLSSAGLVFVHFGRRVIANMLNLDECDPAISVLFEKIYGAFFAEIDAIDNGVPITDHTQRYSVNSDLSSRISRINPQWNQPNTDENTCFMRAVSFVEKEFVDFVHYYGESWYPARELVVAALKHRFELDPSGHIFSLEDKGCPWASHFHELERLEFGEQAVTSHLDLTDPAATTGRPLFCLYRRQDGTWSVQSIPVSEDCKFKSRLLLPESWRGLRDEQLSSVVGIPDCVFVHATGFLGIHKTRDGALYMIRSLLQSANLISKTV